MKSSRMLLAGCIVIVAAAVAASAAQKPQKGMRSAKKAVKHAPSGGILYDQTTSQSGGAWTSQDFETAYDAYDNQGADDFVVPAPGWDINEVFAPGTLTTGVPVTLANVVFYNNAAGIPGAAVCSYSSIPASDDGTGNVTIALAPSCVLAPGTYWMSAVARKDFATGGQWFWFGSTVQANSPAQWQNPGGGFGTGCATWAPLSACIGGDPDFSFSLSGVLVPVELQGFTIE